MFGTFFCATSVVTQDTAKIDWEAMRVIQLVMVADKYDSNALLTRKPTTMVTNNGQPGNLGRRTGYPVDRVWRRSDQFYKITSHNTSRGVNGV